MTDEKRMLQSIQKDLLAVRLDIAALRESFERAGLINAPVPAGSDPANIRFRPPVLKKFGDMLQIIAQSNPVSAEALQKAGFDAEKDVPFDPEKDVKVDKDAGMDMDSSTDTDPNKKDADPNARDFLPSWLGGDSDPTPRDATMNPADKKRDKKRDPEPMDTMDDSDPDRPRPDTEADRIEP